MRDQLQLSDKTFYGHIDIIDNNIYKSIFYFPSIIIIHTSIYLFIL